jgi:hypothetical protein
MFPRPWDLTQDSLDMPIHFSSLRLPISRPSCYPWYVTIALPLMCHALTKVQTVFATIVGSTPSWLDHVMSIAWTWLHLLHFDIGNQCKGILEDTHNKPWRPIPSGRITVHIASRLRWIVLVLCLMLSATISWWLMIPSTLFMLAAYVNNDTFLSGHWVGKNLMSALGYCILETGATLIMCMLSWA